MLDAPDSAGEPLQAPPDPESRQLYAHVLPKPFNWAVFESVANLPGGNDRNFSAGSPDPDLVLTFLALRGKSIGKREPPIALKSFYRKQKDFANDPRKPPVISLPSGDGLGSPESTIGWAPFALIEYEDSNKDGKWDPRDKVVRRVELADLEFDRIVRGSLPDADTSAEPIPSPDYYEPFEVTPDPAADANILSLSSSTLSRLHAHLSLSLLAPHSPVEHEGHLALHPKSTLLRLALGTSIRKNTRIALETYLLTSRRNENKTRVAIWSAESKGWLLTNGAGSESPEVAFLGLPAHAESNGTEIPIFLNVGDKLGKKELETVLGKLPKVAARSLSQYPGITGHRVVLSFGGQPTDSILL